jgi:hypothetical protein
MTSAAPIAATFCCPDMKRNLEHDCEEHSDPFECPDHLIVRSGAGYGIIVHDGGMSYIRIAFCPWCGSKLESVET